MALNRCGGSGEDATLAPVTPALPALLAVLFAAPAAVRSANAPVLRCEGRAAPRLHEESSQVSVTRLRTERAARENAVRSCMAALRAMPLGDRTVGDRLAGDPVLAREIEAVVRATRPADGPRFFSDGGAALVLAVPLDGRLARLLTGAEAWPARRPAAGSP